MTVSASLRHLANWCHFGKQNLPSGPVISGSMASKNRTTLSGSVALMVRLWPPNVLNCSRPLASLISEFSICKNFWLSNGTNIVFLLYMKRLLITVKIDRHPPFIHTQVLYQRPGETPKKPTKKPAKEPLFVPAFVTQNTLK